MSSTDCIICAHHAPDDDGRCTDRCRHTHAEPGWLVCARCSQRIRRNLDDIGRAWEISALGAVSTGDSLSSDRSLPGGTEWLDWRCSGELEAMLVGWVRVWHEDMTTEHDAPAFPAVTVPSLVLWLRGHLDPFGYAHVAIDEMHLELGAWSSRGRRLIGEVKVGQVVLCPTPNGDDVCGRRLRVDVARPEDVIVCRACSTEWTSGRLLLHGVAGNTDAWVDPAAIHSVTGIDPSTLRKWARAGKVARRHGQYRLADVIDARESERAHFC